MREERLFNIILTIGAGLLFFGGGAAVAVFLTEPSQPYWTLIVWAGGISMAIGGLILLLLLGHTLSNPGRRGASKRKMISGLIIAVSITLFVIGIFSYVTPDVDLRLRSPAPQPAPNGPDLRKTGEFILLPEIKTKNFSVDPQSNTYREIKDKPNLAKVSLEKPPSILSIFMHDSLSVAGATIQGHNDVGWPNNSSTRIFYFVFNDMTQNSRFLAIYLYDRELLLSSAAFLSKSYKDIFANTDRQIGFSLKQQGESEESFSWKGTFSGRIYLYTEDTFSTEQAAFLLKEFRDNGAAVQFRSQDYALGAWDNMKRGAVPAIDAYELVGNPPEITPILAPK
jgi:hypothetical protein